MTSPEDWILCYIRTYLYLYSSVAEGYTNYSGLALYDGKLTELIGAVIFLTNIKFLRLLRFNKHIHQFAATLRLARSSLGGFGLMAMIIFLNFTLTALLIFGTTLETFSKFIMSFQTLFSMLIGKFDLREMTGQMDRSVVVITTCLMRCLCDFSISTTMNVLYSVIKKQNYF